MEITMPILIIRGEKKQYDRGVSYETIANEYASCYKEPIALVKVNGVLQELTKKVDTDAAVTFVTISDSTALKTYARTAQMMLICAVNRVLQAKSPALHVKIEFSLGNACYCTISGEAAVPVTEELAAQVEDEMRRMCEAAMPISKKNYPIRDAIELFRRQGMEDKVKLFHFRRSSTVNVYTLDGMHDYFYGFMMANTRHVKLFHVESYQGGLLLITPTTEHPDRLDPFRDQPSLFEQLLLSTKWGELVNITTVGDLNEQICGGSISDMILVQEALQERRIGDIAREIYDRKDTKFVLIAGPSSSGKTTFSHRLAIQLRSFGLRPHIIGLDDYFVNREKTPVDIDGNYNFDCLEAVDLALFNDDMEDLLDGHEIELPSFDFKLGKRVYKGKTLQLGERDILLVEGIHGLNPKTTESLPDENKFKIYISALTSLNIDEHNRIPSSDARLLRRIARDARTRGLDARDTLRQWKSVRDGEEQYIFPYQESADAVFNSVLIYELAVLKQFAEPELFNIKPGEPEYYEAKRLLKFLDYFVGVDTAAVPTNSLCREFVGGGCFQL